VSIRAAGHALPRAPPLRLAAPQLGGLPVERGARASSTIMRDYDLGARSRSLDGHNPHYRSAARLYHGNALAGAKRPGQTGRLSNEKRSTGQMRAK
jgi:hypothetical protein